MSFNYSHGYILMLITRSLSFFFPFSSSNFENSVSRIKAWVADRSTPSPATTLSPSSSTTHLASIGNSIAAMSPSVASSVDTPKTTLTSSQRKRIKAYLKRCRVHRDHSQLNLEGYLLLPVQRVPRYRLLVTTNLIFTINGKI